MGGEEEILLDELNELVTTLKIWLRLKLLDEIRKVIPAIEFLLYIIRWAQLYGFFVIVLSWIIRKNSSFFTVNFSSHLCQWYDQ